MTIHRLRWTNLVSVQGDGGEGESGDMQGAVLHKSTDVAHCPPKHPCAVHKADLTRYTQTYIHHT